MFFKEWEVLLVDDEPDVLSVSRLAMRDFEVYGLPLKIHTVASKAEALELLTSRPEPLWIGLSVAFIDVVMETDTAGLELCQYIREEMGNKLIQLFIRTGQPGIAPERAVIDRYDINGYFTKAEATEDKLYSLVKSGVRQYLWSRMSLMTITTFDRIIAASGSREKIAENLQGFVGKLGAGKGETAADLQEMPRVSWVGDTLLTAKGWDEKEAAARRDQLKQLEGISLGPDGDKYVRDENNYQLMHVAAQPSNAEVNFLFRTAFTPPDEIIAMFHRSVKSLATAWSQAA